jgi:hypothetical protein
MPAKLDYLTNDIAQFTVLPKTRSKFEIFKCLYLIYKFQIGPHMAARVKNANTTIPPSPKLCNLIPSPNTFAQLNDPSLFPRIIIVITLLLI